MPDIDDPLQAVRALHAPRGSYWLECPECRGYEDELAGWPCSTAELVYSLEEVASALDAVREVVRSRPKDGLTRFIEQQLKDDMRLQRPRSRASDPLGDYALEANDES